MTCGAGSLSRCDGQRCSGGGWGTRMLGRVLKNRYKLIDERGSGSMATVYIGRDLETNRLYAVKVLSRQAAAESELVQRFHPQFELFTPLSPPHVLTPSAFP